MRINGKILAIVLCIMMLFVASAEETVTYAAVYSASNPIPEIAANVRPAVVRIVGSEESWDPDTRVAKVEAIAGGSGTYFRMHDDGVGGYILTNYHVVQDCDTLSIIWLDDTEMDVELVGYDDGTDIAVLEFKEEVPNGAVPVPLGDSEALVIGEMVIAIGNPGPGLGQQLVGTVTAGIVSGLQRAADSDNFSRDIDVIQTDAAINTGNSGGALLNAKGELVGIPTLKYMYNYDVVFEGLGFCIPISTVAPYIDQIIDTGKVVRPRMGMTVAAVDGPEEPMRSYPPAGVQIYEVEEGGPAEAAGLQSGDIIVEANGDRVYTFTDLTRYIDSTSVGDAIELRVYRYYDADGNLTGSYEELFVSVTLEYLD
ncbi:MAG: trypsin-like peptidase domain-containing protein [Clostridia bacterium]|nr:trypsin-like peptidase domain-containing protein [Clostridia bacterium]